MEPNLNKEDFFKQVKTGLRITTPNKAIGWTAIVLGLLCGSVTLSHVAQRCATDLHQDRRDFACVICLQLG